MPAPRRAPPPRGSRARPPRGSRAGLAGVEFALLAPAMLSLLLGTVDLSDALLTWRRLELAAIQMAELATTAAAQQQSQSSLTRQQAWQTTTAPFALFPEWTAPAARGTFSITLSDVEFAAAPAGCTSGCSWSGAVRWSAASELGQPTLRACGGVAPARDDAAPSYTTLPADDFGPSPVLVADVSATFRPMFYGFLLGDIPMMQSAYVSPRVGGGVALTGAGSRGVFLTC